MNIRYLQNGEPTTNTTSILWVSGTLAEDKGALNWGAILDKSIKYDMK